MKFVLVALLLTTAAQAQIWPTKGWRTNEALTPYFRDFEKYLFDANADYMTNSALVIYKGKIVYERYAYGFTKTSAQRWWSSSKSVANALIARAVKQGKLNIEEPISRFLVTMRPSQEYGEASLRDLLHMSPGLKWMEGYEAAFWKSNVVKMLYTSRGFSDMASYTSMQKYKRAPGEKFLYSSGFTNLLMAALKSRMTTKEYNEYPWKELFDKIGVSNATWEQDQSGTFVGSSYLYLPLRQMAKVAYLYLKKGRWEGQRLFPKNWVKFTTSLAPSINNTNRPGKYNRVSYGAHWWLNQDLPEKGEVRSFEDVPEDLFYASGHHGQHVHVIPSGELIVLRTGRDRKDSVDVNQYLKLAIKAVK